MPPPFDTPSLRHHYLDALTSHIGAHKFYPLAARRRGVEGSVVIRFTLLAGGLVSDLECQGHKLLRSAACEAVNNSRPLPPPPAALQLPLAIEFSMRFTLSP